jgi:hypothetical protein
MQSTPDFGNIREGIRNGQTETKTAAENAAHGINNIRTS